MPTAPPARRGAGWSTIEIPGWTNDRFFTFPRDNWDEVTSLEFPNFLPGERSLYVPWAGHEASKRLIAALHSKDSKLARKITPIDFYFAIFDKVEELNSHMRKIREITRLIHTTVEAWKDGVDDIIDIVYHKLALPCIQASPLFEFDFNPSRRQFQDADSVKAFVRGAMDAVWEYIVDSMKEPSPRRPFDERAAFNYVPDPATLRGHFIVIDGRRKKRNRPLERVWLDGYYNECIPPYKPKSTPKPLQGPSSPSIKSTSALGAGSPLEDKHTSSRSNTDSSSFSTSASDSSRTSVDDSSPDSPPTKRLCPTNSSLEVPATS